VQVVPLLLDEGFHLRLALHESPPQDLPGSCSLALAHGSALLMSVTGWIRTVTVPKVPGPSYLLGRHCFATLDEAVRNDCRLFIKEVEHAKLHPTPVSPQLVD